MWYFKKTAQSVWNASKNLIDNRTPVQKLIDSLAQSKQQILPTNKLSQLSTLTYQVDTFDQIVNIIFERLKKFQYELSQSQKTLNILVTTNYLIKHGATGFVDEFRKYIYMFKKYEELQTKLTYQDLITQAQLDGNIDKIKSRAHHISELLSNKQKLLKQKQLSMLVKQKLKLYEKNKLSQLKSQNYSNQGDRKANKFESLTNKKNLQDLSAKLEGIFESYVWKYVDKLDQTIQTASEKVMEQIDKFVLGQHQPHSKFQMQEDQNNEESPQKYTKSKSPPNDKFQQQDDDDLMKKLQQQTKNAQIVNENLLQFQEVNPRIVQKQPIQDLI